MKKTPHRLFSRGQIFNEYTILIALVVAAIVAMQVYVQRTLQARYRAGTQRLIKQLRKTSGNAEVPFQYEPYYAQSCIMVNQDSNYQEKFQGLKGKWRKRGYKASDLKRIRTIRNVSEIVEKQGNVATLTARAAGCQEMGSQCDAEKGLECCPGLQCVSGTCQGF